MTLIPPPPPSASTTGSTAARSIGEWTPTTRQGIFMRSTQDEVMYGGSKMGAKTDGLLMWSIMRRQKYPRSRGLFIRRQITEITKQGAAWDRVHELLGDRVEYNSSPTHKITFPNKSVLEFNHCKDEESKQHYQGAQYDDICVLRGTPVLMGDGKWKAIEQIIVGDVVATLEGPRTVIATQTMGVQPIATVTTAYGSATFSSTHRFMLGDGSWASPNGLLATLSPPSGKHESGSLPKSPAMVMQPAYSSSDQQRVPVSAGQGTEDKPVQPSAAWSASGQNDCGESGDAHREGPQPERWSGQVTLLSRALLSAESVGDDGRNAPAGSSLLSFPNGYLGGLRSCDAPVLSWLANDQDNTQPQAGAGKGIPDGLRSDDQGNIHGHTLGSYIHPYTKEIRSRSEDVRPADAYMVRAGEGEVFDLTVASASHFIVFPGIIAQNCFDQLEQFSETQYTFIMAACRVPVTNAPKDSQGNAIQARIRSSANPGGIGHAWVKARFVDVAPPNQTYTYTETINHPDGHTLSYDRTRIFIPSLLFDNPHADPRYAAALAALPEQLRDAYLYGKWDVFVGQGFPDFQARTREGLPYHVIPTEPIPETWIKAEGHDWGYASPFYHCWGAIDPQGGLVIYRELSARHWATDEIASQVVMRRGGERVATTWAGHDIFHTNRARLTQQMEEALEEKGQLLRSINEQYRMAGLNTCVIVPNLDRIAGKQKIHQLLRPRHDGIPYLRIMDCCPILIKTLSEIPIDQARVEDVETDYPEDAVVRDDPYDGFRYLVMGLNLNIQPMLPPPPQPPAWQEPVMRW